MTDFHIHKDLLDLAQKGIDFRHALHKIPEYSGKEFKTAAFCKEVLKTSGFKITEFANYTGFWADMGGLDSAKTIAIRTDMDALAMPDLTQDAHTSIHDGLAHNCGHDMHMAIALLSALFVAEHKDTLPCNVRYIFQMAEERADVAGASQMVALGCMEGVSEIYALHNDASLDYGTIRVKNGIISSYGTLWDLQISGKAAHSSTPHKGLDALREGARILSQMDYIVAKRTNPFSPAVFSCGVFRGGDVPNAVADSAFLQGMLRAMDSDTNAVLLDSFKDIEAQSAAFGFKSAFNYIQVPAIINHKVCVEQILNAAKKLLKHQDKLESPCDPMHASEDFSHMINALPSKKGAMFFLGSGNKARGICNYLHANPYYVEDKAVVIGAQMWVNIIFSNTL